MKKNNSKYFKFIMEAAKEFHNAGNKTPRKTDYCTAVSKKINKSQYHDDRTENQVRTRVSRVIDELSEGTNNKLLCIKHKFYVLNTDAYFKEKLVEEYYAYLSDKIITKRKDVFRLSYNMCGVLAELKDNESKVSLDKIFQECIGENCYSILECDDLLLIMLKCNPDDKNIPTEISRENFIIDIIEETIARIFEDQEKKGLKPLKRKRKRKSQKTPSPNQVTSNSGS